MTGEVTTLKHELRDDTVERGALVSLALGSLAKLDEVLSGLGDIIGKEVEDDTVRLGCNEQSCQQELNQNKS